MIVEECRGEPVFRTAVLWR
ncbi:hypothetical protein R3I93_019860 [Phoxinus phoxinus]|uniref:Uncharacterized protein n=1 Tax=Phoxinus phoxinus TaxID=58324 RepID=A0AAN9CCD6_9TELE